MTSSASFTIQIRPLNEPASSFSSSKATEMAVLPALVTTPLAPFFSSSLTSLFFALPAGCSDTSTMSPVRMPCSWSSAPTPAVAVSGPSSSTVLPPSPVRCALTTRPVRATPARCRAAGLWAATSEAVSAVSAASSASSKARWVAANVEISRGSDLEAMAIPGSAVMRSCAVLSDGWGFTKAVMSSDCALKKVRPVGGVWSYVVKSDELWFPSLKEKNE